jgi:hypothetical protein
MSKLHSKIVNDKDDNWFDDLKKKKEDDESEYGEPIESVKFKSSKTGVRPSGKPVRYLSGKKLSETPEREFKRFKKQHKRR